MKNQNRAVNIIKITEKEITKYKKKKEGDIFEEGDLIHLIDDEYVILSESNKLLKQKINNTNTVLKKNK